MTIYHMSLLFMIFTSHGKILKLGSSRGLEGQFQSCFWGQWQYKIKRKIVCLSPSSPLILIPLVSSPHPIKVNEKFQKALMLSPLLSPTSKSIALYLTQCQFHLLTAKRNQNNFLIIYPMYIIGWGNFVFSMYT